MNENLKPGGPADDPDRTEELNHTEHENQTEHVNRTEQLPAAPPGPGAGQKPDQATTSPVTPSVTERLAALSGRTGDAAPATADRPVTFDEPVRVPETGAGPAPVPPPTLPTATPTATPTTLPPDPSDSLPTAPAAASVPAGTSAPQVPTRASGARVGTVVWGLVVIAIGVGLLATAAGYRIDLQVAAILLLGVAGVALVGGSILTSLRRRR